MLFEAYGRKGRAVEYCDPHRKLTLLGSQRNYRLFVGTKYVGKPIVNKSLWKYSVMRCCQDNNLPNVGARPLLAGTR